MDKCLKKFFLYYHLKNCTILLLLEMFAVSLLSSVIIVTGFTVALPSFHEMTSFQSVLMW